MGWGRMYLSMVRSVGLGCDPVHLGPGEREWIKSCLGSDRVSLHVLKCYT